MPTETIRIRDAASPQLQQIAMQAAAATSALGATQGGMAGAVGQLAQSLIGLTGLGGPLGLAALGLSVLAGAAAGAVTGVISVVRSAAEAADGLERLGKITDRERESTQRAARALDSADSAGAALKVTIASELSPAVAGLAAEMDAAATGAQSLIRSFDSTFGAGTFGRMLVGLTTGSAGLGVFDQLVKAGKDAGEQATTLAEQQKEQAQNAAVMAQAKKDQAAAEERIAEATSADPQRTKLEYQVKLADAVAEQAAARFSDAQGTSAEASALQAMFAATDLQAAAEKELDRYVQDETEHWRELAKQRRAAANAANLGAVAALYQQSSDSNRRVAGAMGATVDSANRGALAGAAQSAASAVDNARKAQDSLAKIATGAKEAAASTLAAWLDSFDKILAAADTFAGRSLAAHKALGLAQIVVSTAAGIMRAYEDLPIYLAIPASIGILATGIAQGAVVAGAHLGSGPGAARAPSQIAAGSAGPSGFSPGGQSGSSVAAVGGGGQSRSARGASIQVQSVGGYVPLRDFVHALNRAMKKHHIVLDGS